LGENKVATILNQPRTNPVPLPSAPALPGGGSPSGGGSGHEVEWDAESVKKLGHAFESEVGAIFRQARNKLNVKPRDAQPAAFTTFGISCALVYTQLIEFADQDLISKTENLKEINDKLQKTAGNEEEADRRSVIKEI
jgi:hypothetical protein